ncbi:MAG: Npt1/Npt2 family nucleotide transporter, partial [Candidatus Electryoneaceae bacterium]|nr:Npt1/Npt2 family nucleotide transporter [Candidatus Electryoneaceae bacterium]
AICEQFATVYTITNWVSMFVQLFLTSFIMTRFGLTVALLILPLAALVGSTTFMAIPILWIGSGLNTVDNGFSYSINQSAKETLYVPTSAEEKYKAKAFIDMFVQRFAKALAVGLTLTITMIFTDFSTVRWLSLATIAIIVVWIFAVRHAGNKFKEMTT